MKSTWLLSALAVVSGGLVSAEDFPMNLDEPKPKWSTAMLRIGDKEHSVLRDRSKSSTEVRVGNRILQVEPRVFRLREFDSLKTVWEEEIPSGVSVRYLNRQGNTLVFESCKTNEHGEEIGRPELTRRVIKDGSKPAKLEIPFSETETTVRVVEVRVEGLDLYALTLATEPEDFTSQPVGYRLTKFNDGKRTWTRYFKSEGGLPSPGAFLLGSLGPGIDGHRARRIVELGELILVQAGEKEHLLAMKKSDGSVKWKVPAIWEYDRGFTGPSVWQYHVGRYGLQRWDTEYAEQTLEEAERENKGKLSEAQKEYFEAARKQLAEFREKAKAKPGWLFAGPVVLKGDPDQGPRIFIVTARSDEQRWANYLAKCAVYELDEDGRVLSMVELPRLVQRNDVTRLSDRVVWRTQADSILQLFPTTESWGRGDTFTKFEWRRQPTVAPRKAFLKQGAIYDPVAFENSLMIHVNEGGFVRKQDTGKMQFPIVLTDLTTRKSETIELQLSFEGQVELPSTNYSSDENGTTSLAGILFMLRDITLDKDRLSLSFEYGSEEKLHLLEFNAEILGSAIKRISGK